MAVTQVKVFARNSSIVLIILIAHNSRFNAHFFLLVVFQVAVIERLKAIFTVLVLNTYLQDATIFNTLVPVG